MLDRLERVGEVSGSAIERGGEKKGRKSEKHEWYSLKESSRTVAAEKLVRSTSDSSSRTFIVYRKGKKRHSQPVSASRPWERKAVGGMMVGSSGRKFESSAVRSHRLLPYQASANKRQPTGPSSRRRFEGMCSMLSEVTLVAAEKASERM